MPYMQAAMLAVKADRKADYITMSGMVWEIFRDLGALRVTECWEDAVPEGDVTSMPMAVKREPGEAVVLTLVEWPDKATYEAAMPRMGEDPRWADIGAAIGTEPFDGARMIWGGFEPVFEAHAGESA